MSYSKYNQPPIMLEKPTLFGTQDYGLSDNSNPFAPYNNYKRALEDYYGQAKPEQPPQDPNALYPRDRSHFPGEPQSEKNDKNFFFVPRRFSKFNLRTWRM